MIRLNDTNHIDGFIQARGKNAICGKHTSVLCLKGQFTSKYTQKCTFHLLPVVLFIHLNCFGLSYRVLEI